MGEIHCFEFVSNLSPLLIIRNPSGLRVGQINYRSSTKAERGLFANCYSIKSISSWSGIRWTSEPLNGGERNFGQAHSFLLPFYISVVSATANHTRHKYLFPNVEDRHNPAYLPRFQEIADR